MTVDPNASGVSANFCLPMSGITEQAQLMLTEFWPKTLDNIQSLSYNDFKGQELPLARIKKIMKLDEDVKMISAEAPVLFAKAAEIFISELSLRAWIHTEDNKRRTLQRNDIAMAISKFDQFDFLIDIVPREELKPTKRSDDSRVTSNLPEQINYYLQLAQQQSQQQQQQAQPVQTQTVVAQPAPATQPATQIVTATPQATGQANVMAIQLPTGQYIQQQLPFQNQAQTQVIQVQAPQQIQQLQQVQQMQPQQQVLVQQPQVQAATAQAVVQQAAAQPQTQVYQQVVTPTGEIQNVPVTLSQTQLQAIQMQLQGKQSDQPIIIQMNQGVQPAQQQVQPVQQTFQQPMFQIQQVAPGAQQIVIQGTEADGQTDVQEAS